MMLTMFRRSGRRFVLAAACLYVDGTLLQRATDRAFPASHAATEIALLAVLAAMFVIVPTRIASARPLRAATLSGVSIMAANAVLIGLDLTLLRGQVRLECGPVVYAVSEAIIAAVIAVLAGLASGTLCLALTTRHPRQAN
ncbi:MAG: hypothetical protein JO306_07820 [Gemmatimonadetes bacterium]|nr:hypothetical protein [Gemmatimonadota bacterium]